MENMSCVFLSNYRVLPCYLVLGQVAQGVHCTVVCICACESRSLCRASELIGTGRDASVHARATDASCTCSSGKKEPSPGFDVKPPIPPYVRTVRSALVNHSRGYARVPVSTPSVELHRIGAF